MDVTSTGAADDGLRDFRGVYLTHYGFVWHALHRFGTAPVALDDAAQDVFVVAYRRRADYRGPSPKLWLYGIARRVASNYRRAHRRRTQHDQALPLAMRRPQHDGTHEALETFERYLMGLRRADRELFVLSELEGMTGPELADLTGRNVQTIYTRVRKLKDDLREHLGELERVRRARPRASAQSWALLLPALEGSSLAIGGLAAPAISIPIWGWTLGSVGATVLALVIATPVLDDEPSRPVLQGGSELATQLAADDDARAHRDPPAAVLELPTISAPAPVGVHTSVPVAVTTHEHPTPARPRSRDEAPKQEPGPGLGVQTELLRRANEALGAGDAAAALRVTDEHARRFPDSVLTDLRTAVRIEALCKLGKTSQARGEAEVFLRNHPGSPVAERIECACTPAPHELAAPDTSGA